MTTERIRFFLPGPSYVRDDTRQAMTAPSMGHRGADFKALYNGMQGPLRQVFRTTSDVLMASGSATLVMESAVVSTVASSVLHCTCGAFAERWLAISRTHGLDADELSAPWGEAIDLDVLRAALRRKAYDAVTITHNETSTGVLNPLAELAAVVREESDALVLVDCVSSLGGAPVETDRWGLDIALAGSQKALAAPPGVVVFTFSERARRQAGRKERRGFYTDLLEYQKYHEKSGTITTPPIPILHALAHQLETIASEGVEARWQRHREARAHTERWAAAEGYAYASAPNCGSPTVSCLRPPPGLDSPTLVQDLAARGVTVGGGYGKWKPETFRIGHMGEVGVADLDALFADIAAVARPTTSAV
jgi:aspartate aminotransferase-like enzyme